MSDWETAPTASEWETASAPARMNPNLRAQGLKAEDFRAAGEVLNQRDQGIDYRSGIQDAGFRANLSRMDNEAERARFLDKELGKGKWGKDSFGAYFVKPEALDRFGIVSRRPVSIDEQTTTLHDVADWAGDLPAIVGATGVGLTATGVGAPAGIALTALGGAGGYGFSEVVKNLRGEQDKTAGQVGIGLAKEGAMAGLGEGIVRTLSPIARFMFGPGAARMTPEKKAAANDAIAQGFKIRPGSVTDAPILARWEGMVRSIFGDLYAGQNRKAAKTGIDRLTAMAGNPTNSEAAGEAIAQAIKQERTAFGASMSMKYAEVDALSGARPFIPTRPMKDVAQRIFEAMPKTAEGKVVGGKDGFVKDILSMGEYMTVENAQRLRTMLREASQSPDLIPDVAMHDARILHKSVSDAFSEAENAVTTQLPPANQKQVIAKLRQADVEYAKGIRKFDNPTVTAITKDATRTGAVDPEMVVEYLIKPDRVARVRRVKEVVAPAEWGKVKAAHAQDLLANVSRGTDDPLMTVFDGRAFRDALENYGRPVLEEVHGKPWVDAAYGYANALMLAEKQMKLSGGIVAANVALHPVQHLPLLAWLGGLAKVMQSPTAFKYLTTGVQLNPATKEGAAAITRVFTQAAANARDETGSAKVSIQ